MVHNNPFIWHELVTHDQKKSGAFFSSLLGWKTKDVDAGDFGTYTLFQKEGQDVAKSIRELQKLDLTSEKPRRRIVTQGDAAEKALGKRPRDYLGRAGKKGVIVPILRLPEQDR